MLVFAEYAGTIITLIRTKNLDAILQTNHELKEELYSRHHQIEHYKEAIRTLLREQKQQHNCLAFYNERRLLFATPQAIEMVGAPLSPLSLPHVGEFVILADKTRQTKQPQNSLITTPCGSQLLCTAIPDRDQNTVAIVMRPSKNLINFEQSLAVLKDPSRWDYLLYLKQPNQERVSNKLFGNNSTIC